MDEIITEKNYPIQRLWLFKSILRPLLVLIIVVFYFWLLQPIGIEYSENSSYIPMISIGIFVIFQFVFVILRWATFHYSLEGQFLTLRQGILSREERHIPYGAIQNLFVKQDLFDRIFGLASLTVENASEGAGAFTTPQGQEVFGLSIGNQRQRQVEMVGFFGNKVSIPGLTKANAEILKGIVLQKMKENPIEDSQSGL